MTGREALQAWAMAEADCLEAMYAAAGERSREALGMSHTRLGGAVVGVMSDDPTGGSWNRCAGLGVEGALTGDLLDEMIDFARTGGAPLLAVPESPGVDPELLASRGLTPAGTWVAFLASGGSTAEAHTDLHLEQIGPDIGKHFAHVICAGSGMPEDSPLPGWFVEVMGAPGFTSYAAFDGWKIVAVASLFVDGGLAALCGAATLPEERGRGAYSGLLARRVDDANALGVRCTAAHTAGGDAPAVRQLRRLGLAQLHERRDWIWRP